MDVTKVSAALTEAQNQLNAVTDEEFKARRLNGLRPLTLAANAIVLAQKHIATATERTTPKGEAPAAPAGGEKAAGKKAAGK
jgi:hypothetical protein